MEWPPASCVYVGVGVGAVCVCVCVSPCRSVHGSSPVRSSGRAVAVQRCQRRTVRAGDDASGWCGDHCSLGGCSGFPLTPWRTIGVGAGESHVYKHSPTYSCQWPVLVADGTRARACRRRGCDWLNVDQV